MLGQDIESKLNKLEYMSNWVSLSSLQKRCTAKKPFIKLRRFENDQFKRKHEMTINHLYMQKLYLICFALKHGMRLDLSMNYYEQSNGLIFGVYEMYEQGAKAKHMPKIQMEQLISSSSDISSLNEFVNQSTNIFFKLVQDLKFSPQDQYTLWCGKITEIFKNQQLTADTFMEEYQKLTLSQHYVFNVKLKNALLMPTLLQNPDSIQRLSVLVKEESEILQQLFTEHCRKNSKNNKIEKQQEKKRDLLTIIKELEHLIHEIWTILQSKCKVVEKSLGSVQVKTKTKQSSNEFKIQLKFLIILSPSRSTAVINEQTLENTQQKQSKILTKIQIKPQNGSILPVSGNAINVNMIWQAFLDEQSYRLKLECFNNRKIQQMYFDELQQFWYKLENDESFRDLVGVDKYWMIHNISNKQKQKEGSKNMQTMFTNNIPNCTLLSSIKQVDKIVSLAIAMDEAIQICQRKGCEHEDPNNFMLEPYMLSHVKQRFKRALFQIEDNYEKLYKIPLMNY